MLTIHVLPRWLKGFLLTHPLYKSPVIAEMGTNVVPKWILSYGWINSIIPDVFKGESYGHQDDNS